MRLIIAGGRTFDDYPLLEYEVDKLLAPVKDVKIEIVSGCQITIDKDTGRWYGADYLGELYAAAHGLPVKPFPADWKKYGNAAGPIRNRAMAEYATDCIVFWDGKSKGTKSMIELAKKRMLYLTIIRYEESRNSSR